MKDRKESDMEPIFVIGSISSEGTETTMHTKRDVLEVSFVRPVNFTGSFTSGVDQPKGEAMKLVLSNLSGTNTDQDTEPIFGKHLREAAAIVKDWHRNP
jgi:hypothetical protein